MNYNLLYAISILVFVILLYHNLNNVQEGIENINDDNDWKETINAWTISFKQLFKKIQQDKEMIQRLNKDCQKYQEIYNCLEDRQKALMGKDTQKREGNSKNAELRKEKAKAAIKKLKGFLT